MPLLVIVALQWLAKKLFIVFVIQLILSFGMAFLTYTGFQKGLDFLKDSIFDTLGQLPDNTYNLLLIAGVGDGLGYLFGAMSFYAAMKSTKRLRFAFWGE